MAVLVGNGFNLFIVLGVSGADANGTVLSASDLGQVLASKQIAVRTRL